MELNCEYLSSFLSKRVKTMICTEGISQECNTHSLTQHGTLNWRYIELEIEESEEFNIKQKLKYHPQKLTDSGEERLILQQIRKLAPVFLQCEKYLKHLYLDIYCKTYSTFLTWTSQTQIFYECFSLINKSDGDDEDALLSLLLITAALERSLGDLYLMKAKKCPSLLRDLLSTQELEDILGRTVICVLKILVGSPKSLNIRNVAWHGFFTPGELPKRYIYFLLILVPSIGEILQLKMIEGSMIPHRDLIIIPQQQPHISIGYELNKNNIDNILANNEFIPKSTLSLWKRSFYYYMIGRYSYCTCLLWPLLEHGLRYIFTKVNKCPERMLTAEATTLYTTFTEILAKMISTEEDNKLITTLGETCMNLLMDLLVYPDGPRLRDRLSHGETCLSNFPKYWVERQLQLAIYILNIFKESDNSTVVDVDSLMPIIKQTENYESQYHPISLLKNKIRDLAVLNSCIIKWLNVDPTLQSWNIKAGCDIFIENNPIYRQMSSRIAEIKLMTTENTQVDSFTNAWFSEVFSDNVYIIDNLLKSKISTLYRFDDSKAFDMNDTSCSVSIVRESEIVNLLLRIMTEMTTVSTQLKSTVILRQDKLNTKDLRSRQRDNTKRLILSLPVIDISAYFVCVFSIYHLYNLSIYSPENLCFLQRCLKSTLQFSENLRTYTSPDKNKWNEAMELCLKHVIKLCDTLNIINNLK